MSNKIIIRYSVNEDLMTLESITYIGISNCKPIKFQTSIINF